MSRIPLVAILFFALYAIPYAISDQPISPEDRLSDFFSTHLARTGGIFYRSEGDALFAIRGAVPRGFVYSRRPGRLGDALPGAFPGFILIWAAVKAVSPAGISRLINPLCGAVSLALVYRIARIILESERGGAAAALALAVNPVLVRRTYLYSADVCNLACYLGLFAVLLHCLRKARRRHYLLAGVLAGWLLWMRPANGVYLLPLGLLIYLERGGMRRPGPMCALLAAGALGAGLLIYSQYCYGRFLPIGYAAAPGPAALIDALRTRPSSWLGPAKNVPLLLFLGAPLLPFALLGLPGFASGGPARSFRAFFILQAVLAIAVFAGSEAWGRPQGELTLSSPFLRQILPLQALGCVFIGRALGCGRETARPLLAAAVIGSGLFALLAFGGIVETVGQSAYARAGRDFLIDETSADGVIFTRYWDSAVFPDRMVYPAGCHFPEDEYGPAIEGVRERGRPVYTTSHPGDRTVREYVENHFRHREISGPRRLSGWARRAARFAPRELSPLSLVTAVPPLACVTDIDGTITGKASPTSRSRQRIPLLRGREALWWIHDQGVAIFYLSTRKPESRAVTQDMLRDYPPGEMILMENRDEPIREYKSRTIRDIQEGYRVVFGVGDSDVDRAAYQDCGIPALRLRPSVDERWEELRPEIESLVCSEGNAPASLVPPLSDRRPGVNPSAIEPGRPSLLSR